MADNHVQLLIMSDRKSFLFIYADDVGTRESLVEVLNDMRLVETWRYDMPNVFYLVSDADANTLAEQFEEKRGAEGRYLFIQCSSDRQGRLPSETWYLLHNKEHKTD